MSLTCVRTRCSQSTIRQLMLRFACPSSRSRATRFRVDLCELAKPATRVLDAVQCMDRDAGRDLTFHPLRLCRCGHFVDDGQCLCRFGHYRGMRFGSDASGDSQDLCAVMDCRKATLLFHHMVSVFHVCPGIGNCLRCHLQPDPVAGGSRSHAEHLHISMDWRAGS